MAENTDPEIQKVLDEARRQFNTHLTMMKIDIAYSLLELQASFAKLKEENPELYKKAFGE